MSQKYVDTLTQSEIVALSDEEWQNYYRYSLEHGRIYAYRGVTNTPELYFFISKLPTSLRLVQDNGTWQLGQGLGIIPDFLLRPELLNEEEFVQKMKAFTNIPQELLTELLKAEVPSYDDLM